MVLRFGVVLWLVCLAAAGPIVWDDSKCSQSCNGGTKFQYSEQSSYIYSFESSNEIQVEGASDLSMGMKATVKVSPVSKCEMVLQILDVTSQHGPLLETSSKFVEDLKRNPLPFSWDDGRIEHVCPSPDDSHDVNNIKKAILSAFQNNMKSFEANRYTKEVDVLGSCDTQYSLTEVKNERFVLKKDKKISTCTDHMKGQTLLLASFYESASQRQHLPILSGEGLLCTQIIDNGIVEEVQCEEKSEFKPYLQYGYDVETHAKISLKKMSVEPAARIPYRTVRSESLVFRHTPKTPKDDSREAEAQNILRSVCENSADLLSKDAASTMHKLVYTIRSLSQESLERIYNSLKNKQLCNSGKGLTLFVDSLKSANSGGALGLLTKLAATGQLRKLEALFWLTTLPFTSYVEEESIAAVLPLLKKDSAKKVGLLGVSALAYKYCTVTGDCENSKAVKDVSSSLKQFLGDKCQSGNTEEQIQIMSGLKAFGNLGYIGESADALFECASLPTNPIPIRIAAVEAFRRAPCTEDIVSKLLDLYKNKLEDDEVRIASLISLSRCPTVEIIRQVLESYESETSNQVGVFTWSYLENLQESSDPLKSKIQTLLWAEEIKAPSSTDITKFSRNFQFSLFSEFLNLGGSIEANVIHSRNSYLPRSGSIGYKANIFGNQLDVVELGGRVEDLEYIIEKLLGPRGLMPNLEIDDLLNLVPENLKNRVKRSTDALKSKIDTLSERYGYDRGQQLPHGSAYVRILGHEVDWLQLDKDMLSRYEGFNIKEILQTVASTDSIDMTKKLLYLDACMIFPSVTGRAYKLSGNLSSTLGLKGQGKLDLTQPDLPIPRADIEGSFQPSILTDATATFTIHSEDFEPGVRGHNYGSAGVNLDVKFEMKQGRLLHLKLKRKENRQEILFAKRTVSHMNHNGLIEHPQPPSYNLNYCTKYIQYFTGARYCASMTVPHFYNPQGKPKLPFERPWEVSVVVEETDKNMDGYEFLLELPEWGRWDVRNYRLLLDTPNSSIDRKFSIDLNAKRPKTGSLSAVLKVYSPFYTLDISGDMVNQNDKFKLNMEGLGNNKRRYQLSLDVNKDVRGARLVEYQPQLSVTLPNQSPIEVSGTIVCAKGRKDQITVNLQSNSFSSPIIVKGNIAKEGDFDLDLDTELKLHSDLNITAFSQIHKLHASIGNQNGKGLYAHIGAHYEPDGRSYESITYNAALENVHVRDRLSFSLSSTILLAEHEDLNSMFKWDFSLKPLEHLKNDILFRYGKSFEDDTHLVRFTQSLAFGGDFDTFQRIDIENKLGLTISCLNFDRSAALSVVWDFVDKPKFMIEVGLKTNKENHVSLKYDYSQVSDNPLKLASEASIIYYTKKIHYRNQVQEIGNDEYQGKAVLEPGDNKQVNIDYIYRIKSEDDIFHHELDATTNFPGKPVPLQQKIVLMYSKEKFHFSSLTDSGTGTPSTLDIKSERGGKCELALNTEYIDGQFVVDNEASVRSIRADFNLKKVVDKKISIIGSLTPGDPKNLNLEVQWDGDGQNKVVVDAKSTKGTEDGIEKYIMSAKINYVGALSVDISGKVSTDLLRGPHYFRADYSGKEPMAIEFTHEIKNGKLESFGRYLKNDAERLRMDIKGQFVITGYKLELDGGIFTSSPYKSLDGKEVSFKILADSTETNRLFLSEYRIKPVSIINYAGKMEYQRKRGWPGHVKALAQVTVHNRPAIEGNVNIDYGNGKYSIKSNFTPLSKRKIQFLSTFEHSARFAAFHHSLATSFQYLQTVDMKAVADLRNMEDAKIHSNLDVNKHQLYSVNSTIKLRTIIDFEAELVILSKITPSLKVFSRTQASGQLTKYEMNLDVDSQSLVTGSGEIKKRKKGFNGDVMFKYKGKEFLALTINQEAKSQRERNYIIKSKTPWRSHNANIKVNKDKKGSVKYETKFCREGTEQCISVDVAYKEVNDMHEYHISYKRGEVDFSIERIRVSTNELSRFHTVIYKGDVRYGYDLRFHRESSGQAASLGIILPSREIVHKFTIEELSFRTPKVKWEFQADAKRHPERKLAVSLRLENHLADSNPSKLDIIISHPIYEKPIEIKLVGDYEPSQHKFFTGEMSLDYSTDPEDKLIGKLSVEKGIIPTAILNVYHQDEQHLDFVVKLNGTLSADEDYLGLIWNWSEESGDKEAYIIFHSQEKGDKFYFAYKRPTLSYRLEGVDVSPKTLLGETSEMDITSTFNGEVKKAKLILNYATGCLTLNIFKGGEKKRTYDLCFSDNSRKLMSVLVEGLDDEGQWTFQYSLDVIRKNWRTLGITNNFNPEFLGQALFHISSLVDELKAMGVGTPPIYDSPRFQKIKTSLNSKIIQPSLRFFIPEATKFVTHIVRDLALAKRKLIAYYHTLPTFEEVQHFTKKMAHVSRVVVHEVWEVVGSYYKNYFETTLQTVNKLIALVKKTCNENDACSAFVRAYKEEGYPGLVKQFKIYLQNLPERIQNFLSKDHTELKNFLDKAFTILKGALQPLTEYRCGEIVVKGTQLAYQKLEPIARRLLNNLPSYYRSAKARLLSHEYVQKAIQLTKETYFKVKAEALKIDYKRLYNIALAQIEEYLLNIDPASPLGSLSSASPPKAFRVIALNTEKGIADFEIFEAATQTLPRRVVRYIARFISNSFDRVLGGPPSWKSVLVKVKRGADLNFFPPYKAQAMLLANQHYVTYDKEFFDFAGECSYLLTRDVGDGNFSVALKPKVGDKEPSIVAWINDVSIELNPSEKLVLIKDSPVDLPYITKDFAVSRSGSTIIIDDKHDVQIRCNLVHELCSFSISGFYYGKTAGLLGTYNYEPSDDFKRPKGQIANSAAVFAKSWELSKGCKSGNLVSDVRINERSDYYKTCKQHFQEEASPLAACFSEVPPKDYMQLCLRHLASASDKTKALCSVSAAYVTECERNYVELSLPSKCLTCTAPDGSTLQHMDKKKYENLPKKSADVVFIVEDHECNKVVTSDLSHLARTVERELENEGYKNNMFGVVGYGGDIGSPEIFTIGGKTFFDAKDISTAGDRMKLESKKPESSRAFEAMKLAVTYLFRGGTAKSFVLLSCSPCKYDLKSLQYPVVQQILLERGISLHVINSAEITVRKSSKEKDIIGVDPDTVYHSKDVTQKDLVGEPALRSQVSVPKDLCIALSQDVNGSFFSSSLVSKKPNEMKNWRSVFARKFIKAVQSYQCQWCDCTSTRDHVPNTICHPCEIKRPRLPFSVCKSCPRTASILRSYLRHFF